MAFSPGMPVFPASPDRGGAMKSLYGDSASASPVMSPSTPPLRTHSPLRHTHRRTDSDVSVTALTGMFENLEVKDPREASRRFKELLEKERMRNAEKLAKIEKEHAKKEKEHEMAISRRDIRIEELRSELEHASGSLEVAITKERYEKERKANKAAINQWETVFKQNEERWKGMQHKMIEAENQSRVFEGKYKSYKKQWIEANNDKLRHSSMIPQLQSKIQTLQRNLQRAESDVKFKTEEATKYKNDVYSLQVEVESTNTRLSEELQALKEKLSLVEAERDALKTSLKEEEVLRIAAEGQIPLPSAEDDERDEFASPVRSPRKQHSNSRQDDDKENVSPKKGAVELRFIQQELAAEKRARERAEEQIDYMKMECQFQCCSCRIAETRGKQFVHDDSLQAEMQRIKSTFTPPASNHEDDVMEDVVMKQEPVEAERPITPVAEQPAQEPDTVVAFSPVTGTFRSVPSPVKAQSAAVLPEPSPVVEMSEAPPMDLETRSVPVPAEVSLPESRPASRVAFARESRKGRSADINIHEDAVEDSDDDNESPSTQEPEPTGPVTPYLTRTITTTTTIPLHFSPATPAFKAGRGPMTPSTVAHAAADAQTPALSELSLNKLGIDREAALAAIRERRGRAKSMAAGQGTPMKQMFEGVKDRRDISAPIPRVRSVSRMRSVSRAQR
ncbi:hypothetical protein COCC4DRAFT_203761 [Bipolaris maydis ATCC 48331]|uniref:MAD multi-domain protein n=2 Tax=Cochliobolus heterostrophus TaxID=5016 RepID=M2V3X1_COCH5|nr:uncharacterized protein COCC4DRAFT_203761 [Bipolaris maydis ATCC 48331]EMD94697.1 hypothetical protein COCHEDRAFT_1201253 [Bipolaris maydis C5]KAJ5062151.1 hypothetical protein J3E74DRAFT_473796 [Bipolaris maydis]ENI01591.1 hypothetical protein COCC4DRAFT_203761 [Bipolaris maydis ATCC 48331]KAJ6215127.1 hypothetical protein PSV09DRAFT_1201253 [Bipolaris maydis]KAJ6276263.1 hypothetical protein PSV08DRAFT_214660 [Bipolaris maydis]